ncbi:hypothetical protein [Bacillus sp. EB01]|uniref:hypothetical protein n=1 Tax=Bacillus sp. EB01 TaxID=1347086 RepID=UPI0005C70193|nr:hypothetical protein [Bacillus sp. EB01]
MINSPGNEVFYKAEMEKCPFLRIKKGEEFLAVSGFHFYDTHQVEAGNIVTRPGCRGKGLLAKN